METLAKRLEKKGRNNELGEYEFQRERDLREWWVSITITVLILDRKRKLKIEEKIEREKKLNLKPGTVELVRKTCFAYDINFHSSLGPVTIYILLLLWNFIPWAIEPRILHIIWSGRGSNSETSPRYIAWVSASRLFDKKNYIYFIVIIKFHQTI